MEGPIRSDDTSFRRCEVRGFTLIELSIVIVIIGLIAGGVLIGRDLIEAAHIRKFASQIESYKVAIQTFQLKYNAYPGDIANAERYWGTESGTCPNAVDPTPHATTCNGNGNGKIDGFNEINRFWQHLANAELIPGKYSGHNAFVPGVTGPRTPFGDLSYICLVIDRGTIINDTALQYNYPGIYDNIIFASVGPSMLNGFSAALVQRIDSMIDDGKPGTGTLAVMRPDALYGNANNCATSSVASTALYNVPDGTQCHIYFPSAY